MTIFAFYQAIGSKKKTVLATNSLKVLKLEIVRRISIFISCLGIACKIHFFYLRLFRVQPTYLSDKACKMTVSGLYS